MAIGIKNNIWIYLLILFCLNATSPLVCQSTKNYIVLFADKNGTPHSIQNPLDFLSQRSIDRRLRQSISIDSTDLGVSSIYIDSLKNLNIKIQHTTKWLNGAIISCDDQQLMDTLNKISFIKEIHLNKGFDSPSYISKFKNESTQAIEKLKQSTEYGYAFDQIATVNGIPLHNLGYRGNGMQIAIIDAGFYKVNELPAFEHLFSNNQLIGTKDFVNPNSNIFDEHTHGMNVLSIIGGEIANTYMGTAPEASFWLLRSEDDASEYPIEADYWICAAEFADSVGVDVINSSLGYTTYDNPSLNLTPIGLDGSSRVSSAAQMAVNKGMVVLVSAGNEGSNSWRYISTPSDPKDVLCVGAMTVDSIKASFSSEGFGPINTIKPDIMAMGVNDAIQSSSGSITHGNGTSFSSPVACGLTACLWQSLPFLKSKEIVQLIRESANNFSHPNLLTGYGIADFYKAYLIGTDQYQHDKNDLTVWPNPFMNEINIRINNIDIKGVDILLYNLAGKKVIELINIESSTAIKNLNYLPIGVYFMALKYPGHTSNYKLLKK